MQGVPPRFSDEKDRMRFRYLEQLPGVEPYYAHIFYYAFESHTHEAFGIGVIKQGAECSRYRGSQHIAATDAIVAMNPDELHTGEAEIVNGWRYRTIYLEPGRSEVVTGVRDWWFSEVVREDPLRSRQIGQTIYGLWHSDDPLAQQGLLLDPIDALRPLTHRASAQGEAGHRSDRVCDYLHDNYMHPITLDELAQAVVLSPYYFQRQFKIRYHAMPHQVLMAIRLWRAKAFLTYGIPAAEVAIAVGLTDQPHLICAFTLRYDIMPVCYQKQVARY